MLVFRTPSRRSRSKLRPGLRNTKAFFTGREPARGKMFFPKVNVFVGVCLPRLLENKVAGWARLASAEAFARPRERKERESVEAGRFFAICTLGIDSVVPGPRKKVRPLNFYDQSRVINCQHGVMLNTAILYDYVRLYITPNLKLP